MDVRNKETKKIIFSLVFTVLILETVDVESTKSTFVNGDFLIFFLTHLNLK